MKFLQLDYIWPTLVVRSCMCCEFIVVELHLAHLSYSQLHSLATIVGIYISTTF